ncbi:hypothetical protein TetV_550 [Tetraselmis virus 1]|uniref:Uncharacterized protein n=1 Tax=Tetraselmis virus 1 TaxID=2060617 RepID=A0A2P0VP34_9VIRU|nr:hypothetical protein QJ968_gp504 [Tetraselmis virus 1]AUF82632.1 hypothetical protein TetV_550 [Tetraselmis virus 1]
MNRFLMKRVVFALWFLRSMRGILINSLMFPSNALSFPFRGMATGIEHIEKNENKAPKRKRVIWLRNPVRLLIGLRKCKTKRREWLENRIRNLPKKDNLIYVLHYWDRGLKSMILTEKPKRGLHPAPEKSPGPCPSKIVSACHDGKDVTDILTPISASFHPMEREVCSENIYHYYASVSKKPVKELRSHPIYIMDSTLTEREHFM